MTNSESMYTHDLPPGDIAALLERLRRVDGVRYDCTILVWEQCQALTQELDRLQRLVDSLAARVAAQAELQLLVEDLKARVGAQAWLLAQKAERREM